MLIERAYFCFASILNGRYIPLRRRSERTKLNSNQGNARWSKEGRYVLKTYAIDLDVYIRAYRQDVSKSLLANIYLTLA